MEKYIVLQFFQKKNEFCFSKNIDFSEVSVGFSIVSDRCFEKIRAS